MTDSNQYFQAFSSEVKKHQLYDKIAILYRMESYKKNEKTALSLLSLIPSAGYVEKYANIKDDLNERAVDAIRAEVSETLMKCLQNIKPAQFESWQDAKQFDLMLHHINGSITNESTRAKFENLRQQIRVTWQAEVAKMGEAQRQEILATFQTEQAVQDQFRSQMTKLTLAHGEAQQKLSLQLTHLQLDIKTDHLNIDANLLKLQSDLGDIGLKIDAQTLILLKADETIHKDVTLALKFLSVQEQRHQEQAKQQKIAADYQGIIQGFAFLGALGEFTDSKALQTISVIGAEAAKIDFAITQLSQTAGLAALNPIAAIGMSVLAIASSLFGRRRNPNKAVMKALRQVSKQIHDLHKDMHTRFDIVHEHLGYIEQMIVHNFQQIIQLIAIPTMSKLDTIHSELQTLAAHMNVGFQTVILDDLVNTIHTINKIEQGILPEPNEQQLMTMLNKLTIWLNEKAASPQFTGRLYLAGTNQKAQNSLWSSNAEQAYRMLNRVGSQRNVMPMLVALTPEVRSLVQQSEKIPHTGIWAQALEAYLKLRHQYQEKLRDCYDPKGVECQMIIKQAEFLTEVLSSLSCRASVLQAHYNNVLTKLRGLEVLQNQILKRHANIFTKLIEECDQPLEVTDNLEELAKKSTDETKAVVQKHTCHYSSIMRYKGNRNHAAAEMEKQLQHQQITAQQCFEHLQNITKTVSVDCFPPVLRLAQRLDLLKVSFSFEAVLLMQTNYLTHPKYFNRLVHARDHHRHGHYTIQSLFNLNINIEFEGQTYQITEPHKHDVMARLTSGQIQREQIVSHNSNLVLMFNEGKDKLLSFYAILNPKALENCINKVTQHLQQKLSDTHRAYFQELSNICRKPNSLFYQILRDTTLAKHIAQCHQYQASMPIDDILEKCHQAETAMQDLMRLDIITLNQFFRQDLEKICNPDNTIECIPKVFALEGSAQDDNDADDNLSVEKAEIPVFQPLQDVTIALAKCHHLLDTIKANNPNIELSTTSATSTSSRESTNQQHQDTPAKQSNTSLLQGWFSLLGNQSGNTQSTTDHQQLSLQHPKGPQ